MAETTRRIMLASLIVLLAAGLITAAVTLATRTVRLRFRGNTDPCDVGSGISS